MFKVEVEYSKGATELSDYNLNQLQAETDLPKKN